MECILPYIGYCSLWFTFFITFFFYKKPFLSFLSLSISIFILVLLYLLDNFSVNIVREFSSVNTNTLYKILAFYSNHEGSMLLWVWCLSLCNICFKTCVRNNDSIKNNTITIQSIIVSIFILFCIFFANPFSINKIIYDEGMGFNPLLDDIGFVFHPPFTFFGYVGSSILYSLATSMLIAKKTNEYWFEVLRSISLILFSLLTLGVSLGSWWAYRELGWGGFWFWDPVENVALLTWLLITLLIHLLKLSKINCYYKTISLCTANTVFLSTIFGSFITRSGILNSVHSFTNNIEAGIFILSFLLLLLLINIFCIFKNKIEYKYNFSNNNQIFIIVPIIMLLILALLIFFSIVYPLLYYVFTSYKISIDDSYYNDIFNVLVLFMLGIQSIAILIFYSKKKYFYIKKTIWIISLCISLAISYYIIDIIKCGTKNSIAIILANMIIISMFCDFILHIFQTKYISLNYRIMFLAHIGIAIIVLGIAISLGGKESQQIRVSIGESFVFHNKKFTLYQNNIMKKNDYVASKLTLIDDNHEKIFIEYRFYLKYKIIKLKTAILNVFFSNYYFIINEFNDDKEFKLQLYYYPYISVIWLGSLVTLMSGIVYIANKVKYKL